MISPKTLRSVINELQTFGESFPQDFARLSLKSFKFE